MKSHNLVVQGPPGTGKSQTITNIIANALAAGQTVLFVCEKLAALEVVKRRLDRAGLGEFCLELHSHKSSPKQVVESLSSRYYTNDKGRSAVRADAQTWDASRCEIGAYLNDLHAEEKDGETPFTLMWRAIAGGTKLGDTVEKFRSVKLPPSLISQPDDALRLSNQIAIYADVAETFARSYGPPRNSHWANLQFSTAPRSEAPAILELVKTIHSASSELLGLLEDYRELQISTVADMRLLAAAMEALTPPPDVSGIDEIVASGHGEMARALRLRKSLFDLDGQLKGAREIRALKNEVLTLAAKFCHASWTVAHDELTPTQAVRATNNFIAQSERLTPLLQRMLEPITLMGFDGSFAAGNLELFLSASRAVCEVPDHLKPYLSFRPKSDDDAIKLVRAGVAYQKAEADWKVKAPGYNLDPAQNPVDLRSAAETRRLTGFPNLFAALSGRSKLAKAQAARPGIDYDREDCAELLDGLAQHIEDFAAFEQSNAHSEVLGALWNNRETPFNLIDQAIGHRRNIESTFKGSDALAILEKAYRVRSAEFAQMSSYFVLAAPFMTLQKEERALLDDRGIAAVIAGLKTDRARFFLDQDVGGVLSPITLNLSDLRNYVTLEQRSRGIADELSEMAEEPLLVELVKTPADAERVSQTLEWLKAVKNAKLPVSTAKLFKSSGVLRHYEDAKAICAYSAKPMSALQNAVEQLRYPHRLVYLADLTRHPTDRGKRSGREGPQRLSRIYRKPWTRLGSCDRS